MQAKRDLGDDAEGSLRADEEPREVVAGRRLARARARLDRAAVGEHDGQAEHVLAHRAVADRGRARRARRRHAAQRRVGAGIDWKPQAGVAQRFAQLQACDARLDRRVEIVDADADDLLHLPQIDRDAAVNGVDVAFERRPRAERHDRHRVARADRRDRGDFFSARRKADDVGARRCVVGLAVAVMLADGGGVGRARPEARFELRDRVRDRRVARRDRHASPVYRFRRQSCGIRGDWRARA